MRFSTALAGLLVLAGLVAGDSIDMRKCPDDIIIEVKEGKRFGKTDVESKVQKLIDKLIELYPDSNPDVTGWAGNPVADDKKYYPGDLYEFHYDVTVDGYDADVCSFTLEVRVPVCVFEEVDHMVAFAMDGSPMTPGEEYSIGTQMTVGPLDEGSTAAPHCDRYAGKMWTDEKYYVEQIQTCRLTEELDRDDIRVATWVNGPISIDDIKWEDVSCQNVKCATEEPEEGYVYYDHCSVHEIAVHDCFDFWYDIDHEFNWGRNKLKMHEYYSVKCDYNNGFHPVNTVNADDNRNHTIKLYECVMNNDYVYEDNSISGTWQKVATDVDFTCEFDESMCALRCDSVLDFISDEVCIPQSWICDGVTNCNGVFPGDDEAGCEPPIHCSTHMCNDVHDDTEEEVCIDQWWICDGMDDCTDGSDEVGCGSCSTHMCVSLHHDTTQEVCLEASWICDEEEDCQDGSDERHCDYTCPTYTCASVWADGEEDLCLPESWICDMAPDCVDGSDEVGCGTCDYHCANSSICIPSNWTCDGFVDCPEGDDESCGYLCHNSGGYSIPPSWVCDGMDDCREGDDEEGCTQRECEEDETRCPSNGRCILNWYICDAYDDCGDNWDERDCEYYHCWGQNDTIPFSWLCDGVADCMYSDDEEGCSTTHRPHTPTPEPQERYHCMDDWGTIPLYWVCDGVADCFGGDDEEGCPTTHRPHTPTPEPQEEYHCAWEALTIPYYWVCDGMEDCMYGDDEEGCSTTHRPHTPTPEPQTTHRSHTSTPDPTPSRPQEEMWTCPEGFEIQISWLCDNWDDCGNGTDEQCHLCGGDGEIRPLTCSNDGRCIMPEMICDGIFDCESWEDEDNCGLYENEHCDSGMIHCPGTVDTCINPAQICDFHDDCPTAWDEDNCFAMLDVSVGNTTVSVPLIWNEDIGQEVTICGGSDWNDDGDDEVCGVMGFGQASDSNSIPTHMFDHLRDDMARITRNSDGTFSISYGTCDEVLTLTCQYNSECGVRHRDYNDDYYHVDFSARINNGEEAQNGSWPWFGALRHNGAHICGVTFISDQWAITAQQCVYGRETYQSQFTVVYGSTYLPAGIEVDIDDIIVHNNYNNVTKKNDVALLKLAEPIELGPYAQPVCLPETRDHFSDRANTMECYMVGFGNIDPWEIRGTSDLLQARVLLHEDSLCAIDPQIASTGNWNNNKMMCAGFAHGYQTICNEDRGGPLMCRNKADQWTLAGIASWNVIDFTTDLTGYCSGLSVFAEVTAFTDFIHETVDSSLPRPNF